MYTKLQTVCKIFCLCEGFTAALTSLSPLFSLFFSLLICVSLPLNHIDSSMMSDSRNLLCNLCVPVQQRVWVCTRAYVLCVSACMPTVHTGCCLHVFFEVFEAHLLPHLSPSSLPSALLLAHMKSEVIPKKPPFPSFLRQKAFLVKNILMCW